MQTKRHKYLISFSPGRSKRHESRRKSQNGPRVRSCISFLSQWIFGNLVERVAVNVPMRNCRCARRNTDEMLFVDQRLLMEMHESATMRSSGDARFSPTYFPSGFASRWLLVPWKIERTARFNCSDNADISLGAATKTIFSNNVSNSTFEKWERRNRHVRLDPRKLLDIRTIARSTVFGVIRGSDVDLVYVDCIADVVRVRHCTYRNAKIKNSAPVAVTSSLRQEYITREIGYLTVTREEVKSTQRTRAHTPSASCTGTRARVQHVHRAPVLQLWQWVKFAVNGRWGPVWFERNVTRATTVSSSSSSILSRFVAETHRPGNN